MAEEYVISKKEDLVSIADAIRSMSGTTGKLKIPTGFLTTLNEVSGAPSQLGEKLYSFGVLSDPHLYHGSTYAEGRFDDALTLFESMGVDMVCISGDIADTSAAVEMESYRTVCDNHPNIQVHACTGNHDDDVTNEDWLSYTSHERNYEVIHNGDVFLFMSIDYPYESSTTPYTTALEWVKERLERYKGARIFLFMHFPPTGYSGLLEGQFYGFSNTSTQDDELITKLNQTKNVTVFHGHSHYSFDIEENTDTLNIYRFNSSKVNLIHVPSCNYTRDEFGDSHFDNTQGYYVDVYDDGFVVTGIDLINGTEMKEYEYMITTDNNPNPLSNAMFVDLKEATLGASESVIGSVYLAEPADATVTLTPNNSAITISPSTLTFTTSNYSIPQSFTITAPAEVSDTQGYVITLSSGIMTDRKVSVTVASSTPVLASCDTWYRSSTPRSNITAINIVNSVNDVPSTYSETWDASEGEYGTVNAYIDGTTLYIAGNGSGKIAVAEEASYMFSDSADTDFFSSTTSLTGLNLLDTSSTQYMDQMFRGLSALTELDLSGFDTTSATRMNDMFNGCSSLTSLDVSGFDTSLVTRMYYMFGGCKKLTTLNLSTFNTASAHNMTGMFEGCEGLINLDLSSFDTTNVSRMNYMFAYCSSLVNLNISSFNTSNVSSFERMFESCVALESIDLSRFNTSSATTMSHMFDDCESLTSIDASTFNTSMVVDMEGMFMDCIGLTSLNVSSFSTSNVTTMAEMFDHCDNLSTLNISSFDTSAITDTTGLYRFARKSGITNITVGANFTQSANLPAAGSDGMFYTSATTPLTVTGANSVLQTYDFASDNRTVTFA